jgi:very-short-patch-repair endonuclease
LKTTLITQILEEHTVTPPSSPALLALKAAPHGLGRFSRLLEKGDLLRYSLGAMGITRNVILTKVARVNRQKHTPAEKLLWVALRANGLDGWKFRRQMVIDKFIVDFCCPEGKLIVELDGAIHDSREAQIADALRTEHLIALGYQVIRFRNEEILQNLPEALIMLKKKLQETQTTQE